jgi:hypothetical protein
MYIMKSKKKQKRRGGDSNLESCTDTGFLCNHDDEGKTEYCGKYKPGSVCYSNKCYTPANCRNPTIPNTIDPNALKTNATDPNALKTNAIDPNALKTNAIDPNAVKTNAEDTNDLKTNAEDPNAVKTNAIKTNAIDQDTKNQHTTPVKDGKFGSDNLINGAVGVAGLGAMYMGYKWLNKKKASSDDSSSPEKKKSSRQKRKSSRRKRKSSHRKSISHR